MEKKLESPLKKFVVEKGGNPRGKTVSKEDIKQALRDVTEWFKANAKPYYSKLSAVKPATEDDLKKLQAAAGTALPLSVQVLLGMYNGRLQLLDTFVTMSVAEIMSALKTMKAKKSWKPSYIPIAKDSEQQYLCVDTVGGKENALIVWSEDGIEMPSESFAGYVESIRDSLLLKKLEYDDAMGLISVVDTKK